VSGGADPFETLAAALRREGFPEEAEALDSLLHRTAWTTGTEMLGELGLELKRIRKARWGDIGDEARAAWKEGAARVRTAWPLFPYR
jgi:hypothetical protein